MKQCSVSKQPRLYILKSISVDNGEWKKGYGFHEISVQVHKFTHLVIIKIIKIFTKLTSFIRSDLY